MEGRPLRRAVSVNENSSCMPYFRWLSYHRARHESYQDTENEFCSEKRARYYDFVMYRSIIENNMTKAQSLLANPEDRIRKVYVSMSKHHGDIGISRVALDPFSPTLMLLVCSYILQVKFERRVFQSLNPAFCMIYSRDTSGNNT